MHVMDYLNSIYDSDDLHDYKYGKINPEPLDMPESDKDILLLVLDIIRLNEQYKKKENVFEQFHSDHLPDINSLTRDDLFPLLSIEFSLLPLPIRVLRGAFPARQLKFVLAWAEIHQDELMQDWELAKDNQPLIKIAPLM